MSRLLLSGVLVAALAGWIAWDRLRPSHATLRRFDAHAVARIETAMWRDYYAHRRLRLFSGLAELLRQQYHLRLWTSWAGAYHAARAAVVFQRGHRRQDYEQALPEIRAFYRVIRASSDVPFDVETVSRRELEWWIIHRERERHAPGDLPQAFAALQSAIYGQPAADFTRHAQARADATVICDQGNAAGGEGATDWNRIAQLLDDSWSSLANAVSR